MFLLREPTEDQIRRFVADQKTESLSYSEVEASRGDTAPPGYARNHARVRLGDGEAVFRRAVRAVQRWAMYDMDWIRILPVPAPPIDIGRTVGLLVRHYGFWSLNACRIVYVIDESAAPVKRFGFGYGTLPEHGERGEERFTVERHPDGSVWYELFSFSRPGPLLSWIGYPLSCMLQKRFARESTLVMRAAVEGNLE